MRYFFFGTLMDPDVMAAVIGRPLPTAWASPAKLPGYRRVCLREEPFPTLVPDAGGAVSGIVVDRLTAADIDRILFFESIEYASREATVFLDDGRGVPALVFADSGVVDHRDTAWDFVAWAARRKAEDMRLTRIWMAFYGKYDVTTANRLWDEAVAAERPLEDLVRSLPATSKRTATAG